MVLAPDVTADVLHLDLALVGQGGPLRKPLVEDGRYAEVVVRDLAAAAPGWDAVWVSCWGRRCYVAQPGTDGAEVELPSWALARLSEIDPGFWAGGVFDVFAWNESTGELRFYELKRKGRDRIRPGQVEFARKALAAGAAVTIVEWSVRAAQPPSRFVEKLGGPDCSHALWVQAGTFHDEDGDPVVRWHKCLGCDLHSEERMVGGQWVQQGTFRPEEAGGDEAPQRGGDDQ